MTREEVAVRKQLRDMIGRNVAVQVGDDTLAGALTHVDNECLTLAEAAVVTSAASPVPMEGVTLIAFASVRWVQVV